MIEFKFLISHLVPKSPFGFLTDTLQSALKDPCSIFPSHVSIYLNTVLIFFTYDAASSGDLKSGLETISINATPVLFKSIKDLLGCWSCKDLPASCSR